MKKLNLYCLLALLATVLFLNPSSYALSLTKSDLIHHTATLEKTLLESYHHAAKFSESHQ